MTRNQLPEGVGKKIVEALKRQAEADISPVEDNIITNTLPLTEIEDLPDVQYEPVEETDDSLNDNVIVEEETSDASEQTYQQETKTIEEQPVVDEIDVEQPVKSKIQSFSFESQAVKKENTVKNSAQVKINIPSNVAVLKRLISTLPVGVTKQTGAQIIRQTMEAMGIPMNNVLREAQEVQEELNSSTRECMIKIQEYKTNILQLEQSVQQYQQNITQINDLVSLFLLTDKK